MSAVSEFLDRWEEEEGEEVDEEIILQEEERQDQIDDWIAEAQDLFFEGDYEKAIHYCEKALIENELETDAKDILLMSFFSKSPPSFQSILDYQSKWRQNDKFNENLKDLSIELRASYLLNNSERIAQCAQSILSLLSGSSQPPLFNISFVISALAEFNHHDLAYQFLDWFLPFYKDFPIPSDNSPEAEEWMKMRALLEWSMACDRRLALDHSVSNDQSNLTPSPFLSCIRILIALEKENDKDKAILLWNDIPSPQKKDLHLQAISFLLNELPDCPSSSALNDIVRKRLKLI